MRRRAALQAAFVVAAAVTWPVWSAQVGPGGGGAVVSAAPTTTAPPVPEATLTGPALAADFPDPSVLVDNGTSYAYATENGFLQIQAAASIDMAHWTPITDPLPGLPAWANPFHTWAPSVTRIGDTYLMYYTVQDAASGRQCISLATATQPLGPFSDGSTGPLICQLDEGGSIDPAVFTDADGSHYLTWKSDNNAIGAVPSLWGQALAPDGRSLQGVPSRLLTADAAWQGGVIEGPALVRNGSTYVLFYSGGAWQSAGNAIGYATCTGPLGPCADATTSAPWLTTRGTAAGPGGPSTFVGTDGALRLAFAAWNPAAIGYPAGGQRELWIDRVAWGPAGPVASANTSPVGVASHLAVTAPEGADPGTPFSVTVAALDVTDDPVAAYHGTVALASDDPAAALPPDEALVSGAGTFAGVTLATPGTETVTAADTASPALAGQATVVVAGVSLAAGGTAWSADQHVPDSATPVVVSVTSPHAGTALVRVTRQVELASPGFWPMPWAIEVGAPPATADDPLVIRFSVDAATLLTPPTDGSLAVYDGGALVQPCASGAADPCLQSDAPFDGVMVATVDSTVGGTWSLGTARTARLAGNDRIATAVTVSQATFPVGGSAGAAVLARSDDYPDALAGAPLAAAKNGPLLITPTAGLDPRTGAELTRVLPPGGTVDVLGGTSALSDTVAGQVAALGFTVVRYAGPDRYATAAAIADQGLGDPSTVFEADGRNFPDALAAGAAAASRGAAVLLTAGNVAAPATAAYLAAHPPTARWAVGGPAAAADPGAAAIVGADRYATAALVATRLFDRPALVGIASGENWPDALAGGARAGEHGGPLLLSDPAALSPAAAAYLQPAGSTIVATELYGGTAALSPAVEDGTVGALVG